ncbi:MAG: TIGR01620 family protein [Gammaproteobacteria bacterium]|nr:TIGR01620 family protein [Gammaproteobacteria bacterium]MBU2056741.1 TIGR01620 family protein [Gammaproteobacteria bacterium]MBU2174078.1 TIGR01620 family protein [Gammaproteobacteria bacterium]MBU2247016.1 TIGR01620 family protein [Gammaproteobacteria bacterium]MBU2345227.1 TIGR01620 family protein [Gammaproteobacteria bacterium]
MTALKQAKSFKEADFIGSDAVSELPMARAQQFEQADFVVEPQAVPEQPKRKPVSALLWAGVSSLLLLVAVALYSAVATIRQAFITPGISTVLDALFCVALLTLGSLLLLREWRLWRRLAKTRKWQQAHQRIHATIQYGEAEQLCLDIAAVLPESTQQDVADWKAQKQTEHSDQELLDLFELRVLSKADARVRQQIHQASADTAIAVAVSPFALADMLLVLWRTSKLLRQMAESYGASLGQLRSLLLIKHLFATLLWAASSELALDLGSDLIGAELTSKLSMRSGQGLIAGMLVARLGLAAQQLLRPLPLAQSQKLSLLDLSKALVRRLLGKAAPLST